MARSPLIVGANLTLLDEATTRLLTNPGMVRIDQTATASRQALEDGDLIAWTADMPRDQYALAIFNLGNTPLKVDRKLTELKLPERRWAARNAWTGEQSKINGSVQADLAPHACMLLILSKK